MNETKILQAFNAFFHDSKDKDLPTEIKRFEISLLIAFQKGYRAGYVAGIAEETKLELKIPSGLEN